MRVLLEMRLVVAMVAAAATGIWGLRAFPVDRDDVFLGMVALQSPVAFRVLAHGYAALWFTTPFFAASILTSLLVIVVYRTRPTLQRRRLPRYTAPEDRGTPSLILGETHHLTKPGPSPAPTWLEIPQRGLYTGVMIVGAVGSGKTSACMYPYVDQLLRWRADDPERKIGGLVLEVKGDFCRQVQSMLGAAGRSEDYVEIGLDSGVCYNPLHNDLDPYAVAFAIATLLNNLFGKSKEPFWQQAYTDLLKFVILLRRITTGYTTLAEVYQYILHDAQIDTDIKRLQGLLQRPPEVILVPTPEYQHHCTQRGWIHWFHEGPEYMAHPYDNELEDFLSARGIHFHVGIPNTDGWRERRHQLDAVDRWFRQGWRQLDARLRSSIVEGVAVFLSLFDHSPSVQATFCPPRSAYASDPKPGERRPLPPLENILERGQVVALNFPVAMNPGLARALGVLLKLDFQRAVLQRIPQMAAAPRRVWRDLVFVCDEYHAFATVGETDPSGDERAFALSRQARLIPIVATQSISSLRSALHGDETWRTLLQCFRTKLFLATSDDFTAKVAAELCGRRDRLKAHYSLTEAGHDAHVSLLSGRAASKKHTLTASKTYAPSHDYIFPPRVFTELHHAQAIALPYDGLNPLPPQFCYLKPHYLDVQTSYFNHAAGGAL